MLLSLIFTYVCCCGVDMFCDNITTSNIPSVRSKYTIVIDAGHGGRDVGTIGCDGYFEKDINLNIAKILYDYLMVCGINATLTRDGDYETYKENDNRKKSDLYNRLDYVNSIENSILISIHQNHYDDEAEWGTQIWYSANTELSKTLADCILNNVTYNLQPDNCRNNKESDDSYYLLYKASVPSIMIECGFMSNIEENKKLQSHEYQQDFAYLILTGVCGEV